MFLSFLMLTCTDPDNQQTEQKQNKSSRRGVSYSFSITTDVALLTPGISWFYNWAPDISSTLSSALTGTKIDFFPMAWNGSFDPNRIRNFKALHPECQYILGFNEPNLTDQANMTPTAAAAQWNNLAALANELKMKLISPAMNYGTLPGYSDPIVWLDEFFTKVPLSEVDGIAIHCYMGNASALASYVKRFKKYGKPIWLTEFCGWESNSIKNATSQMFYMSEAVNYLESDTDVVRYAWFIPRSSSGLNSFPFMQLLTDTTPYELSGLGQVFVNMSSLDKSTYYSLNQRIQAENYSSLTLEAAVKAGNWSSCVHLRPTTDVDGCLDLTDFNSDMWLEYQIDAGNNTVSKLEVRYTSLYNASLTVLVDGIETATFSLPKTGADNLWTTASVPVQIHSGKHTIRLLNTYGGTILNWIRITKE